MRPLSATECISPAIERTRLVLFSPFRAGRSWKLCATSYLCRAGTMFFPFPLVYLAMLPVVRHSGGPVLAALFCVGVILFTALVTWIFYLCSRLQFAYFDIVVNRGEFVAPAWRKYGPQALPWTGFKFVLGSVLTLACAIPITAFVRQMLPLFAAMPRPGQPPSPQFAAAMSAFYGGYAIFMLLFGLLFLASSLLADFIVPSLALENTGLQEAFRRMGELIRREPGEFAMYVLLKVALGLATYMCAMIVFEIAFALATLILGAVVLLFGFLLHLAGVSNLILLALAAPVAIAWLLVVPIYSVCLALGSVFTYLDAYAVYFLGGRYPMLGDLLDRSTPAPPLPQAYPSPAPYPAYPPPNQSF